MPCDNCGTNFTNEVPKDLRVNGLEGTYCCGVCADEAEPDTDFTRSVGY